MEKSREQLYVQTYLAMCDMHYYSHNIADYRKDTLGLTLIEHGAYRQLLDQYYLDEKPLPLDEEILYSLVNARNQDEKYAVRYAIKCFFTETKDGKRVLKEKIKLGEFQLQMIKTLQEMGTGDSLLQFQIGRTVAGVSQVLCIAVTADTNNTNLAGDAGFFEI